LAVERRPHLILVQCVVRNSQGMRCTPSLSVLVEQTCARNAAAKEGWRICHANH